MRKKEIVVLDCGVEVRQEEPGVIFTAFDPGREFAFCIKATEIGDMIQYLNSYQISKIDGSKQFQPELSGTEATSKAPTVAEKVASFGVVGELLANPRSAKGGRVVTTGVAVHQS